MSKLPPMKRAGKSTAKAKPAAKKKVEADDAPMPQAVSKPKRTHERTTKPAEKDRIEKGKQIAISYLMRRDEMDAETAAMVVESMDTDTINMLTSEAATAVLDKTQQQAPSAAPTSPATLPATPSDQVAEESEVAAIDFMEVAALVEYQTPDKETFAEIAIRCRDNAATKNEAEKQYKSDKKRLDEVMSAAGIGKNAPVMVTDIKLTRYTGYTNMLSEQKLLEKGVSPDVIKACWVKKPWDDVRVYSPKAD